MDFDTDVLICGAGAAGLTLALDLARRNVPFRLVERQDTPFHGSRGKGIQPRTLEVFEDLGIADRAVALGGPYPPQRIHAADGSHADVPIAAEQAATPAEPYATPLMLPQSLTEQVMRERLLELGQRVECGLALTGLEQDADGVTVTLAGRGGESRLRARYV
ncbi:FAD-dependent monooxygenase, partial [Massilia sp. CT11-108]|uniref:FAD-dependent monooxygenase n=1 Tax=Massilia sp. CT11-108 TaxID=3393900 RepID=UPI0039A4A43B